MRVKLVKLWQATPLEASFSVIHSNAYRRLFVAKINDIKCEGMVTNNHTSIDSAMRSQFEENLYPVFTLRLIFKEKAITKHPEYKAIRLELIKQIIDYSRRRDDHISFITKVGIPPMRKKKCSTADGSTNVDTSALAPSSK